jgi:hypothetical protein
MLPRYATLLGKHVQSIQHWNRPMIRAIHHLLSTIVYAEGCFKSSADQPLTVLVDHIVRIISEANLVDKITKKSSKPETVLIHTAMVTLGILIYEPEVLAHIKQSKITSVFRRLTSAPYEEISVNAYMMLACTMSEDDIKAAGTDSSRLIAIIIHSLRKEVQGKPGQKPNEMKIELLVRSLKGTRTSLT